MAFIVEPESIAQVQKDLDAAKETQRYAESQHQAGLRVLKRSQEETNKLKAVNQQQAEKLEGIKTQLAQVRGENQSLRSGIQSPDWPARRGGPILWWERVEGTVRGS